MGLKNAGEIIPNVLPLVQFSVNEECVANAECDKFKPFIDANKPVFHIEYPKDSPKIATDVKDSMCSATGDAAGSNNFSTVLKNMDLDGFVEYCDGSTANTPLNTTGASS
jgi:hypothetical protein